MPKGIPAAGKRKPRADKGMKRGPRNPIDRITALGNHDRAMVQTALARVPQQFAEPVKNETDEEILARIKNRFEIMDIMAEATAYGENRALIISGPPGLGKSYGVTQIVERLEKVGRHTTHVQGQVRATGLYKTLYDNRHEHCVVVFDDADSIFKDDVCLNLLKVACDTTKTRVISWLAETNMVDENGIKIERRFTFEGSIIFITNQDFDAMIAKGGNMAPHLEALISRSHYLDLAIKSKRDYIVRIKQVVEAGMLKSQGVNAMEEVHILAFIEKNADKLRELSLRMVLKIANIHRQHNKRWQEIAAVTCMK